MQNKDELLEELYNWCDKINAMMLVSTEGECPQMVKAVIFKRMADIWNNGHKKTSQKAYKKAEYLADDFLNKFTYTKELTKEEAERRVYG